MKISKFLVAFLVNAVIGLLLATVTGADVLACVALVNMAGAVMHIIKVQNTSVFYSGLAKEIWLPDVKELFYPDSSFLSQPQDMSSLVDNDAINLADAGTDPTVLFNNSTYPIAETDAVDAALRLVLNTYDTTSTVVRNAVALELAYDQRQLYTSKHKKALLQKFSVDAAWAYAPAASTTNTPIIDATADAAGVILDRIIELQTAYNNLEAPLDGRVLVLDPNHAAIIAKEDKLLFKSFENTPGSMLFGFKVYTFSRNPIYIKSGVTKAALGTAFVGGTHAKSSFSFLKDEVMKAQGTMKLFSLLNSPSHKGDLFNFQMRALAVSIRGKYSAAIIK